MKYKYQYTTEGERDALFQSNSNLYFIEEQNIIDGNFLIFSDEPIPTEPIYEDISQEELNSVKSRLQATEQTVAETSETQQQLIELLIEMEVI